MLSNSLVASDLMSKSKLFGRITEYKEYLGNGLQYSLGSSKLAH